MSPSIQTAGARQTTSWCLRPVVGSLLVDVNLRFTAGSNGLTDRVTPLVGIEYSF